MPEQNYIVKITRFKIIIESTIDGTYRFYDKESKKLTLATNEPTTYASYVAVLELIEHVEDGRLMSLEELLIEYPEIFLS